ncbi:nuclease domain-containing protein, partial [Pseudomonas sp. SIMBA_067]
VSTYTGLNSESLVLQQKTGYSAVYRVWQELKYYLDVFEEQSSVSMKSVAEIYEVWCFLEIRNILINELRFKDKTKKLNNLQLNDFLEYQ